MVGMRLEFTWPKTARAVTVALVKVALVPIRESINALVALRLLVVTPPKKVTATEVVAPRPVTEARVSASAPAGGQLVPFEVQTG